MFEFIILIFSMIAAFSYLFLLGPGRGGRPANELIRKRYYKISLVIAVSLVSVVYGMIHLNAPVIFENFNLAKALLFGALAGIALKHIAGAVFLAQRAINFENSESSHEPPSNP